MQFDIVIEKKSIFIPPNDSWIQTPLKYVWISHSDDVIKDLNVSTAESFNLTFYLGIPIKPKFGEILQNLLYNKKSLNTNGIYMLVSFLKDKFAVTSDALGVFPIFYSIGTDFDVISNSMKECSRLAEHKIEYDRISVLEYIVTEGNLGNSCFLKNVKRLKQDEIILYKNNKLHIENRKQINFDNKNVMIEEVINEQIFDLRYLKKIFPKFVCNLTGGYDSRANLALIKLANIKSLFFTRFTHTKDHPIAKDIADGENLDYYVNTLPKGYGLSTKDRAKDQIFISGIAAGVLRAFYYKNLAKYLSPEKLLSINYLGVKRRLAIENFNDYNQLLNRTLNRFYEIKNIEPNPYLALDIFYLDRVQTWCGYSLVEENGIGTYPTFLTEKLFKIRSNFSLKDVVNNEANKQIIRTYNNERLMKYNFTGKVNKFIRNALNILPTGIEDFVEKLRPSDIEVDERKFNELVENSFLVDLFTKDQLKLFFISNISTLEGMKNIIDFDRKER